MPPGILFAERGFDRSTTRDIGERAGLDPTLITRYFGSKAALYLATLRTDFAAEEPGALRDLLEPDAHAELLDRIDRRGTGPIFDAALRPHPDPVVDAEARAVLTQRFVEPLEQRLTQRAQPRRTPDCRPRSSPQPSSVSPSAAQRRLPRLGRSTSADVADLLAHALGNLRFGPDE